MSRPEKKSGWAQGLYQVSTTPKEAIGAKRTLVDGSVYRYAHNGATALVAGKMLTTTAINSGWAVQLCSAYAAGSQALTLTITAGGTLIANELQNGRLIIATSALVGTPAATKPHGYNFIIDGNSAVASGDTTVNISLAEPIPVALTALNYFTLQPTLWYRTVIYPAATSRIVGGAIPVGVPLVDVAANAYFWCQTKGLGSGRLRFRKATFATFSLAVNFPLVPDVSAGFLTQGIVNSVSAFPSNQVMVGRFLGVASSVSSYNYYAGPVMFDLEAAN